MKFKKTNKIFKHKEHFLKMINLNNFEEAFEAQMNFVNKKYDEKYLQEKNLIEST